MAPAKKSTKRKVVIDSGTSVVKEEVLPITVVKEEPEDREIKIEPDDTDTKTEPDGKKIKKEPKDYPKYPSKCPPNWERVYDNILKMREERDAPVDNMGCEKSHDSEAEPQVNLLVVLFNTP